MSPPFAAYAWGDRLPTLAAARVSLRWLEAGDAAELYALFSDREVMRYWSSPPMSDPAEVSAYLQRTQAGFRSRAFFQWGIARAPENRVVGTCTLFHLEPEHRRAEIGFALGRPHWGQGLAAEALTTLIEFAFDPLDLHRLEADVDPRNERSLRSLTRLGFRQEGLLRDRYHVSGETQDSALLGLLRPDWHSLRARASGSV